MSDETAPVEEKKINWDWSKVLAPLLIFWTYIKLRAKSKLEILMRGFGSMLTIWVVGLFSALIAWVTGNPAGWALFWAAGFGATSQFCVSAIRILFGKPKNGNGEEIAKLMEEAKEDLDAMGSDEPPT